MKILTKLIVVACFVGAAIAQVPSQPPKPGPEHQKLQLWCGEWTYEGEYYATFLGPGGKFTGRMTGRPIMDGFGAEYVFVENGLSGETRAAEPPRSSGVVIVRGTALPYLTQGSGIPCLVTGYSTLYQAIFSEDLMKHFQFIFVDWKNSFLADDPFPQAAQITIDTLVDDLDEVRRQLGHEKIAVLGHSYPGFLPLAYGKKYPKHASHLITIGCPPYASKKTDKASAEYWEQDASPERKAAHQRHLVALPDSLLDKLGARERWVMQYIRDRAICWANPDYDCYWLWLGKGASMDFEHQYYSVLLADYDPTPDFHKITAPVFLANGRYDYWVPPKLWEAQIGKLPNLTYHLFEKSGHWPMWEERELFDRMLIDWLHGVKE